MIRRENPNFVASIYAPNPKEVTYWIDLTEGPDGQIIKSFVNNKWVKVNEDKNSSQDNEIVSLKNRCTNLENNKLDKSTYNAFVTEVNEVHDDLEDSKADKATTLAGYGITDAYTKTEVDGKISSKANSSDVYTKSETDNAINTKVSALVNQAPETMDTLDELAAALGDDPNFATTVANQIGTKLDTSTYNSEKANFATKSEVNARVAANVAESSSATVETLETKVNELINALITAGLMAAA